MTVTATEVSGVLGLTPGTQLIRELTAFQESTKLALKAVIFGILFAA